MARPKLSKAARLRSTRRRRARLARQEHDLTPQQWVALVEQWGGCAYCGASDRALQRDCLQPIAHGGRYTLTNVVPACPSCNASKSEQEVTTWLRRKRLDEANFLVRQAEILHGLMRLGVDTAAPDEPSPHGRDSNRQRA